MSESGMRFIEPPHPNDRVVAAEASGRLTADDMEALVSRLQPIVDRGEKALLYVDMQEYEGSEMGVVTEKFRHIGVLRKGIDKYAVIGDSAWREFMIKIVDPLTSQQMKAFGADAADEAWAWLLASEASDGGQPQA